jgi:hypothetical protein
MDIDELILQRLQARTPAAPPLTIGDIARQFGASRQLVIGAARRLVANQLAQPSMIDDHGVPTLHGLLPL